jgi:hypothetical protein
MATLRATAGIREAAQAGRRRSTTDPRLRADLFGQRRERTDPAWTGVAHALIAELGVGTVTASALQLGLGHAALFGLCRSELRLVGAGLVWASRAANEEAPLPVLRQTEVTA